jgi:hypothetical protein
VVPYILLTLGDFTATGRANNPFEFHFFLDKPTRRAVDALWLTPEQCTLVKRFSNTNQPMGGQNNPCPLSPADLQRVAGNTAWIGDPLLQALMNAAVR